MIKDIGLLRQALHSGASSDDSISTELITDIVDSYLHSNDYCQFTPERYGAVGDGLTDDTAAIQAMFNAWVIDGHVDSFATRFLGNCLLKKKYLITSTITINTAAENVVGGFVDMVGAQFFGPSEAIVAFEFMNYSGGGYYWSGLELFGGTFTDLGLKFTSYDNTYPLFGVKHQHPIVVTSGNLSHDPVDIHAINLNGASECLIDAAKVIWSSTTNDCIANTSSDNGANPTSNVMRNCATRGGKHGISYVGYSLDCYIEGGLVQFSQQEGIYVEALAAVIRGVHLEDNCLDSGDANVYLLGGGFVDALVSQGFVGMDSKAKYALTTYSTRPIVVTGLYHGSDIDGELHAHIDGDGLNNVYLNGVETFDVTVAQQDALLVNGSAYTP